MLVGGTESEYMADLVGTLWIQEFPTLLLAHFQDEGSH